MHKPRIVVVGGGFGGLSVVKGLKSTAVDITLLDYHNYHLFQPLLYQVATASLSPADIASPIRHLVQQPNVQRVVMEEVVGVDKQLQRVITSSNNHYPYDYLVIATGARHSYFGHEHWERYAPGLKDIKDALLLREKILLAFEQAERTQDVQQRQMCLTFVIVGAGPTGVEMAGAVRELAARSLAKDFKNINPKQAQIILIEADSRILNAFPAKLSNLAQQKLIKMGVQVRTQEKVIDVQPGTVVLNTGIIKAKTIIWAAGVRASAASTWLNTLTTKAGHIIVNADLSVPGFPNIYVVGDTAACEDNNSGRYLPGTAAVAKQQGYYLAQAIYRKLAAKPIKPFLYRNYGNLATIGHKYAVADFTKLQVSGIVAYILWWVVHIYFLIGFRNRFFVTLNWLWSFFSFHRGGRIIVKKADENS